eukprot:7959800-Lingulodinium_polyedra.AAC.1
MAVMAALSGGSCQLEILGARGEKSPVERGPCGVQPQELGATAAYVPQLTQLPIGRLQRQAAVTW